MLSRGLSKPWQRRVESLPPGTTFNLSTGDLALDTSVHLEDTTQFVCAVDVRCALRVSIRPLPVRMNVEGTTVVAAEARSGVASLTH